MRLDYSISPRRPAGLEVIAGRSSQSPACSRCLLSCLMVLARREASKDAGLLVLRHEDAMLDRQLGRVRCQPGDPRWLAALSG